MLAALSTELQALAQPDRALVMARYFRTGPGQYAQGDVFLGIPVPQSRAVAKKFPHLAPDDLQSLLDSPLHEYRLVALLVLVAQFRRGTTQERREYCEFYLQNLHRVNNWDLVDTSARDILGEYLVPLDRSLLDTLAQTPHLWTQRVAMIATHAFVKRDQFSDALRLAEGFLTHRHDLIHKATGWTLREIGQRNPEALTEFLDQFAPKMPRTMLRYALEKFPPAERLAYLRTRI